MLRDEQGEIHTVKCGDFIGDRDGLIRELHGEESLRIYQHLYIDGDSEIVFVEMARVN